MWADAVIRTRTLQDAVEQVSELSIPLALWRAMRLWRPAACRVWWVLLPWPLARQLFNSHARPPTL